MTAAPVRTRTARESSRRQGQLAASSLLIIILAAATLLSTKDKALQLRLYSGSSTSTSYGYESLTKSIDLSDIASHKWTNNRTSFRYSGSSHHGGDISRKIEEYTSIDQDDDAAADNEIDDSLNDMFSEIEEAILNGDDDYFTEKLSSRIETLITGNNTKNSTINDHDHGHGHGTTTASPVCHPHFNLALPNNEWSSMPKFKRIYFYHARKAGGSTLHKYLASVARHYGLELEAREWSAMEEPGTREDNSDTFYVTHLREPVSRSISHFKYEGRWGCRSLVYNSTFIPAEDNANKLETWNQTGGHEPYACRNRGPRAKAGKRTQVFYMGTCAVNCYTQWFSGICPGQEISPGHKFQLARRKLYKYNMIFVIEKLGDPQYVQAVEDFFGVPGLTKKGSPFCERQSHKANANTPLIVHDDTRERLTMLNQVDISLYHEFSDCLESGRYNFPKWNSDRFELHSYDEEAAKAEMKAAKAAKALVKAAEKERASSEKRRALSEKRASSEPEQRRFWI